MKGVVNFCYIRCCVSLSVENYTLAETDDEWLVELKADISKDKVEVRRGKLFLL